MERSSTRRSSVNLSDLPKNAIQEILSRLPIKEAGRTSILSRSWRCRWRSIPKLHIYGLYPSRIYHLLLLHSGSIRAFKAVQYESDDEDVPKDEWEDSDLMRYIHILSLNSASTLHTLCLTSFYPHCYIDTIASSFPNLTHLHFTGSLNVYPDFPVFSSLTSLFLYVYDYTDDFSVIISACPLLKDLRVTFATTDERESTSLDIVATFATTDERESTSLDIVAPNLRWLKLAEIAINYFAVTSAPVLEKVNIRSSYYDVEGKEEEADKNSVGGIRNDRLMKIFGGMASIKELELDEEFVLFLGSGHVAERIPVTFGNLKTVSFKADLCSSKAVLGVLCFLRSTPVLQELEIRVCNCLESPNEVLDTGFWEAQEHLFNKLETIVMTNMTYQKNEMGFLKFLLAKAEPLKHILTSFHHWVKNSKIIELQEFPRLSHQAQLLLSRNSAGEEDKFSIVATEELPCPKCWYTL